LIDKFNEFNMLFVCASSWSGWSSSRYSRCCAVYFAVDSVTSQPYQQG